jgi:hypothetical protein
VHRQYVTLGETHELTLTIPLHRPHQVDPICEFERQAKAEAIAGILQTRYESEAEAILPTMFVQDVAPPIPLAKAIAGDIAWKAAYH